MERANHHWSMYIEEKVNGSKNWCIRALALSLSHSLSLGIYICFFAQLNTHWFMPFFHPLSTSTHSYLLVKRTYSITVLLFLLPNNFFLAFSFPSFGVYHLMLSKFLFSFSPGSYCVKSFFSMLPLACVFICAWYRV